MNKQTHYIIRDNRGRYPYWNIYKSKGLEDAAYKGKWVYISFGDGSHAFTNKDVAYGRLEEFNQQVQRAGFDISFEVMAMTKDDWMQLYRNKSDHPILITVK